MALFYGGYTGFSSQNSHRFFQKFAIIHTTITKILLNGNIIDWMEFIYLILRSILQWMMLQTGDYMKMLFLSFWLTMARVINVRLKTASFFQIMVAYFFLLTYYVYVCVRVFVCCMSLARLAVYRWNVVGMNILYWHAALRVSVKQFIVKMVTLILAAHELTLTLQGPLNFLHFNDETILFSRNYNGKNIPWKCFADFTEESAKRCAQFWIDGNLPNENEVRLKPVNDCQNALFGCERITIDPRHIHIKFH